MPTSASNSFAVQLDGLKLSAADRKRISAAIGSAVDREIANIDTGGDAVLSRIPPGLDGKWIRVVGSDIPELRKVFPKEEFRFK